VPHPGESIAAGRPICTVFASGSDAAGCEASLAARASVALASPTSGHFNASMVSESGVQTDLAGNITRSKDTTIVRLDSAAVIVDADNRYRLESPSRAATPSTVYPTRRRSVARADSMVHEVS